MTADPRLTEKFADALGFAAELHARQTRKGGDTPYVGHLLSVTGLVIEAGGTEAQAIAAPEAPMTGPRSSVHLI